PGAAEIRRVERLLRRSFRGPEWVIAPLFGNLPRVAQDRAIAAPEAGRRKIVLATAIAETSLTIEGVRVVVDSGFMRVPRFDVRSGLTRLQTLPVSRASADQRRGRAGRTAPGVCYRLWRREAHQLLNEFNRPEILEADLTGLALELALWGVAEPERLRWLDPPPAAAFLQARRLLADLGALDAGGRVTGQGRQMAGMPLHPRLAHMILAGRAQGLGGLACDLAAMLTERDFVHFQPGERDADLRLRVHLLQDRSPGTPPAGTAVSIDREALRRVVQVAAVLKKRFGLDSQTKQTEAVGRLLAWAYPDRIARRRSGSSGRFLMANGRGAYFSEAEPLAAEEFLVPVELDGEPREARIFRAAAYDSATLQEQFADRIQWEETIEWDARSLSVTACSTLRFGALALKSAPLPAPDLAKVSAALARGIREQGCDCLPWTPSLRRWQARVGFVGRMLPEDEKWPDVSDTRLLATLENWLAPKIAGITRLRDLQRIDLKEALEVLLTWSQGRRLDTLALTHLVVPSGSRIRVDYSGAIPVLAVRIQEMFGAADTPTVAGGREPVLLHLLSPAGRPMQVTRDLAGFWQNSYHQVKKDLKGRYPKHHWPDDALQARATRRTRPRGR
ncbi:MAG: ATP-dependent helicase HrpB, partial [Desulfobacterales bacterium]|nr:ATP-dependent helicase HrpB [Desulfobacterales bacterium]